MKGWSLPSGKKIIISPHPPPYCHSLHSGFEETNVSQLQKIAIITARIILHLISYPQFTYDLFHMHHSPSYLSLEHMNPKLTCSQRQWLHSSVGRASHRYREVTGSSPVEVLNFFRLLYAIAKNAIITARIILHLMYRILWKDTTCIPVYLYLWN